MQYLRNACTFANPFGHRFSVEDEIIGEGRLSGGMQPVIGRGMEGKGLYQVRKIDLNGAVNYGIAVNIIGVLEGRTFKALEDIKPC